MIASSLLLPAVNVSYVLVMVTLPQEEVHSQRRTPGEKGVLLSKVLGGLVEFSAV